MTESAGEKLTAFEKGLSALKDATVAVANNDAYEGASVILSFSNGVTLRTDYWRVFRNGLAVLSSFDHQQKYGLPEPLDARADLHKALDGQQVMEARLDRQTGDLLFAFSGRAHFQVFNLTGYEIWEMTFPEGGTEYSNYVMGSLYEAGTR